MSRCRSQWPCGRRLGSAAARLLRSGVRIPPVTWMFVCCECCVLSGRGFCDELITHPEESYRLCCVVVCYLKTSCMRRPWPSGGCCAKNKQRNKHVSIKNWSSSGRNFHRFIVSLPRRYTANILPEYIKCVQDGVVHVHVIVTVCPSVFEPNTTINPPRGHFHRFVSILYIMITHLSNNRKRTDVRNYTYRGADKSLARPTSRCILFDGENVSFDASLVLYIYSTIFF
jgi:hypothetical protein